MQVFVYLRGSFAMRIRGPLTISLEAPASLLDCLKSVLESNSAVRETWEFPEQVIQECLVMVNDVDVGLTGNLNTRLNDGDVVTILPLIHGG